VVTIPRISTHKAHEFVTARKPFQNSKGTLRGEDYGTVYVVYSYGRHWPLFVWMNGQWYRNRETYSRTTSKHSGQAHPDEQGEIIKKTTQELKQMLHSVGL
jgi:hypothetical protein